MKYWMPSRQDLPLRVLFARCCADSSVRHFHAGAYRHRSEDT